MACGRSLPSCYVLRGLGSRPAAAYRKCHGISDVFDLHSRLGSRFRYPQEFCTGEDATEKHSRPVLAPLPPGPGVTALGPGAPRALPCIGGEKIVIFKAKNKFYCNL